MSTVIVEQDNEIELQVGNKLFHICQGEDGTLFIEAAGSRGIEVTVSDDDDQVTAIGGWVNIDLAPES